MNSFRIGGLVFLAFSLLYGWSASHIPLDYWSLKEAFNARSLPLTLSLIGVLSSLAAIGVRSELAWPFPTHLNWKPLLIICLLMLLYGIGFTFLGFLMASFLLLSASIFFLGERRSGILLLVPGCVIVVFWLLLGSLGIHIEPGEWWYLIFNGTRSGAIPDA